ncbi:MAG: CPBP family glutamic-type intramembrane protease [Rubripirellula sp.]
MDPIEPNPPESSPPRGDSTDPANASGASNEPFVSEFDRINPFAAGPPVTDAAVPTASTVAPNATEGMRWWTPIAISAVSLLSFIMASGVMAIVALAIVHGGLSPDLLRDPDSLRMVSESRLGLFLVVVLPQIALVAPCLIAAYLSPVPTRERLGLVRGNWPVWAWFAAAAATPLVGMVSGLVVGLFMDESETLKEMSQIFRDHGQNGFLLPLAFMIGATPAICEELLFRGYVQTRLTKSFGPVIGVGFASFLFAAFHMDFVHVIAVFPLGLFLGWLTWQSGSLFPAMMAHFVNNVISVVAVAFAPEAEPETLALPTIAFTLGILAMGCLGMVAVSIASIAYRRPNGMESQNGTQLA